MNSPALLRTGIVGFALLSTVGLSACVSKEDDRPPYVSPDVTAGQPTLPQGLAEGWNEIPGGEGTTCARGAPWSFFVYPGTVNRVVIDFIGGGACWNDLTCSVAGQIFTPDIEQVRDLMAAGEVGGIYDKDREDNPVRDYYHVVIPYCTGDVHWGDNVVEYSTGTINHKGAVNARYALDWIYENFSRPEQVLVTGCSAGSYGAALWAAHVMRHYPETSVIQFGDSGAGIITEDFFTQSFPSWNALEAFPDWIDGLDPAQIDLSTMSLADLYVNIANAYPAERMSQYNTAYDEDQLFYFQAMGGGDAEEWSQQMRASLETIDENTDNFTYFIPSGEQHCIIVYDSFYTVEVDGRLLVDWLSDLLEAEAIPAPAACTECTGPTVP